MAAERERARRVSVKPGVLACMLEKLVCPFLDCWLPRQI